MKTAIALSCLLFVLMACNPATATPTATTQAYSPTPTQRSTALPTRTPPEVDIRQPLPTSTLSPTQTSTQTPNPPTATVAPSPTKAPTLTANQEGELAIGLLKNNANCQLPCWWGFTPGKTAWQTARTFFESLGKVPAEYRDTNMLNYSVDFRIQKHDVAIGQIYIVENGSIDAIWVSSGTVRDHETIYGDSHFAEDWQRYFLPQLLATYGQPSQILVRTFRSAPEALIPFNLLLFYPKQGILVWYYGPTTRRGERIRICPQQSDITLALWPPEQELTLGNIASWGLGLPIEEVLEFRPLEEATGINMETFYQTFKNANNPACFETPVGLWSH